MLDWKVGSPVFCTDGKAGRLAYVVVDEDDEVVTGLIVRHGVLLARDVVVPVHWVQRVDEEGIHLNATLKELEAQPVFREVDFRIPDPSARPIQGHPPAEQRVWLGPYVEVSTTARPMIAQRVRLGVDEDEITLGRGVEVMADDGELGTVDHVLVDPETHRVTHIVVRTGPLIPRDLIVPIEKVYSLGSERVAVHGTREELVSSPAYAPAATDAHIRKELIRSLETAEATRDHALKVEVDRGLVRLLGVVPLSVAQAAVEIARRIRGVIAVEDHTTREEGEEAGGEKEN
ncbi:MAG: PRC-barrel domain-containing protein [Anaerolineae bacterium]|nr:PRC-barrel domain-containing protein [Anaerolineae bacterium]